VAGITGMLLLAERFSGIGPWSKYHIVFMLGYGLVVKGLQDSFAGYNVNTISRILGRGQLDHLFIQPQPMWVSLLTMGFCPIQNFHTCVIGAGLVTWAIAMLHMQVTVGWIGLLALNLAGSCAVMLSFTFMWGSLAFYFPRQAEELNMVTGDMMGSLRQFPLDGLGAFFAGGLMTVLPVGFVAWYPSRCLLGLDCTAWHGFSTALAGLAFFIMATWAFSKGLRYYGRVGSQRYSDFGHRR
jgi:ABC-2 type transport system permease protein